MSQWKIWLGRTLGNLFFSEPLLKMSYYYCKIIWLFQRRDVNNTNKKHDDAIDHLYYAPHTKKECSLITLLFVQFRCWQICIRLWPDLTLYTCTVNLSYSPSFPSGITQIWWAAAAPLRLKSAIVACLYSLPCSKEKLNWGDPTSSWRL